MIEALLLGAALAAAPAVGPASPPDTVTGTLTVTFTQVPVELPAGHRELGWDAKHRVWMFDSRDVAVYEVGPSGLEEPRRLEASSDPPELVASSTMGDDPDDWLLFLGGNRFLLFQDGREVLVERPRWFLSSVAYFDGRMAAFALPVLQGEPLGDRLGATPPWLLVLDERVWETELDGDVPVGIVDRADPLMSLRGHLDAHASRSHERGLWLADAYRHRLRYLTHTGRIHTTLTVGSQDVDWIPWPEVDVAEFEEKFGVEPSALGRLRGVTKSVAEGRDGRVYVLGSADVLNREPAGPRSSRAGDLALFRFDPVLLAYESVGVGFPSAPVGRLQMAPGQDGLFVLDYLGSLYFVSWETLDAADWDTVQDARLDGQPLAAP